MLFPQDLRAGRCPPAKLARPAAPSTKTGRRIAGRSPGISDPFMTLFEKQVTAFYTYLWLREDGTPYYVGKGRGRRAFTNRGHTIYKPDDPSRTILLYFSTEREALDCEITLIGRYGRKDIGTGCLRNMTAGGDGVSGYRHTEEGRRRSGAANIGNTYHKGHRHSGEARRKMGEANRGKTLSPEHRRKISIIHRGKEVSEETRKKMSASRTGKPLSPEHREKLRMAWERRRGRAISA